MEEGRIRIVDIAEELGLSTATVSNVIHGKTRKISDETVRRVQELLEEKNYIPSMAGILLAQNNSRIIGVVVNDHEKYESRVLEDSFISSSLNNLAREIENAGYFMMVKVTKECSDITRFASMWNMEGLVVIGFCDQDYKKLRDSMRIPFVVYDGYLKESGRLCNLTIDNYGGGYQVGDCLYKLGHRKVLCVSDNHVCVDQERFLGFHDGMREHGADFLCIPMEKRERKKLFRRKLEQLREYTAVFAVSDYYAVELMQFLQENGVRIPQDMSVCGFDDTPICEMVCPTLTTVKQDGAQRARMAVSLLGQMKRGELKGETFALPVKLVERQSTGKIRERIKSE